MRQTYVSGLLPALLCAVMLAGCAPQPVVEKSDALWHIAGKCERGEKENHLPAPCERVNLARHYVVLKDIRGETQFLLIPTRRVSGIESPVLLRKDAENYWQATWEARGYVIRRAGGRLPEDDIGMAVNSPYARTQNQLHIHIDCLRPDVVAALEASRKKWKGGWFAVGFPHPLHRYRALHVETLAADPFRLAAAKGEDMSRETLVVARVNDGFILLARGADIRRGDRGSGEELLDHACALSHEYPGRLSPRDTAPAK